tara:strand:+ start:331 stop:507 length:177 start_codon:yes stop_codon:yes gene_type:complete
MKKEKKMKNINLQLIKNFYLLKKFFLSHLIALNQKRINKIMDQSIFDKLYIVEMKKLK